MAIKTFAAINIGSYELTMKIFEHSPRIGMREIDHIRHKIDLGANMYDKGTIPYTNVEEMCRVLGEFVGIMNAYHVEEYRAYGTSAMRETKNALLILEQIRIKTGLTVTVVANSEQRFLDYKSILFKGNPFKKQMEKGTAIVDIGGGSIQISLFEQGTLVTTQNIRLGVLRLRDKVFKLKPSQDQIEGLVDELIMNQLFAFKKLYLKEREITTMSIVDDYVSVLYPREHILQEFSDEIKVEQFYEFVASLKAKGKEQLSREYQVDDDTLILLYMAALIVKKIANILNVQTIWASGATLCDGIAYEYAHDNRCIPNLHNFEQDILHSALQMNKKYEVSKKRAEADEANAITIFKAMRRIHGLGERELLLLRLAAILHDTGKYISLSLVGECSYSIITGTEIIGLSHKERIMVACMAKYNHVDFEYYNMMSKVHPIDQETYLTISKLTAILRVASALNKSHKQKFKEVKATLKDNQLFIRVMTHENIILERGLMEERSKLFEDVFSVTISLSQKRNV
ncbi:MAG: exopolyphosphatase [Eubacteriales bacterium]